MAKKWGLESRKLYLAKKKQTKTTVAGAKEVESKKIADQLEQIKSAALKSLFEMAKQSKKNNKGIVGMPYICVKDRNTKVSRKDKIEL